MPALPDISDMDLAALLCSRVCHDIISPVGAIANGLELLDDDSDADTKEIAMGLIRSSATNASSKLQFARIAFGAAGSAGADIDTGDAQAVAQGYFANEKKTDLEWSGERALMRKNKVKLLLNLLLVALHAIPRGGKISASFEDPNGTPSFKVVASGTNARVPPVFLDLLNGSHEEPLDAHGVQPLYTLKLAASEGMAVTAKLDGEAVIFEAKAA
ncbi:MAG: histidine phosphotransferase family protein [Phyllobacteriaceae bacterium]|nr:histidine phosphotransferase family protein [Phyllobacteriaceae bacterium]